jgi:hypothetical protein
MAFFLTGSFNHWRPDHPGFRFQEVTDTYGGGRPGLTLSLGSYTLETRLPPGEIQFKIVEDGSWEHQWSVNVPGSSGKIDLLPFYTRHGLKPNYIIHLGAGKPPHAEYTYPGGVMRWDFHPESRTLTIHPDMQRSAGVRIRPWKWFDLGSGLGFQTYVGLPYGYDPDGGAQCSTCFVFDGRGLMYGEHSAINVWNEPRRQWPRVLDTLSRQGIITPPLVIGIDPPQSGNRSYRSEAYVNRPISTLHQKFMETICTQLIPLVEKEFRVYHNPDLRYLIGHSDGGYMVLTLLTKYPHLFGGAVALSPGGASRALDLPVSARTRVRIAISYTSEDLRPAFVTPTANTRAHLEEAGIRHLLQYMPDATHDPASIYHHLHAAFAYVLR